MLRRKKHNKILLNNFLIKDTIHTIMKGHAISFLLQLFRNSSSNRVNTDPGSFNQLRKRGSAQFIAHHHPRISMNHLRTRRKINIKSRMCQARKYLEPLSAVIQSGSRLPLSRGSESVARRRSGLGEVVSAVGRYFAH